MFPKIDKRNNQSNKKNHFQLSCICTLALTTESNEIQRHACLGGKS